jgi:NADH:ubiquinone oxidoreductase subunit K
MAGLPRVFGFSSQDATTAIAGAEQALQVAFVKVSDSESAGVNVSGLLSRLDDAGSALMLAEAASNNGSYSGAVSQAAASEALADGVATDAVAMKREATDWFGSILAALVIGSVAASVFVIALALTWIWFKRRYGSKVSKSHPEVIV